MKRYSFLCLFLQRLNLLLFHLSIAILALLPDFPRYFPDPAYVTTS